jgi:hypothetical protein
MILNLPRSVVLRQTELISVALSGAMRAIQAQRNGQVHKWGIGLEGNWERDITGAAGEYVLAKLLGIHWAGTGQLFMEADLENTTEVRTTAHPDGRLIMHPEDDDEHNFWLVTGYMDTYVVHGWLPGGAAKRQEYWQDPTGRGRWAFFVPQAALCRECEVTRGGLVYPAVAF